MFESLTHKEHKKEIQREDRAKDFARERDTFNKQDDYAMVMQQDGRNDLLKWQQDLDDELENLKHRLRSEEKTDKGWQVKQINYKDDEGNIFLGPMSPLTNELFIDYIETQVEPFLSRNLINSNFDEKRILDILKYTMNDIVNAMADGWDTFGIEFVNYDLILRLIKNIIIPGPFRALNNGQRLHDRSINRRIEAFNEVTGAEKKKGLLGVFG